MDVTTLAMLFMVMVSAVGFDTVLHPASVVLDASVAGKLDKLTVDSATLSQMLNYEVNAICSTPSVLAPPEIRIESNKGIGMALAQAANMEAVAVALQSRFGSQPERIKLTLIGEDGVIKLLVNGSGMGGRIRTPPFQGQLSLKQGETLAELVHRGALYGMKEIDPYTTALYLVQAHIRDGDFGEVDALIDETKKQLPQTPISFDLSTFENLQGIIALLRNNVNEADAFFHSAVASDPTDAAASLNAAFVDLQLGEYDRAVKHAETLVKGAAGLDKTLLATAYLSWGAALMGLHQLDEADKKLVKAAESDPTISAIYEVWSQVKRAEGDTAAADQLSTKAWEEADAFENYAEVAALYFRVPLIPGQQLTRSPFINANMIRFN